MLLQKQTEIRFSHLKKQCQKWWPELLISLIALFLYIYQLGTESFWIDEILSVESAQGPLNLNRPFYFILLRFWLLFGQSDTWLRTPSVLFGLGCIALTYRLGCQLANRKTGQLSALLLALSPLAINHSQEVRFYMMSTFLGLAGSLCLNHSLQQKTIKSPFSLFGWISLRCLGFLTAQPNILLLFPDLILVGCKALRSPQSRRIRLRQWLLGLTLLFIPTTIILSDVIPELLEFLSYTTHIESAKPGIFNLVGKFAALTIWPIRGPEYDWSNSFCPPLFNLYSVVVLGLIALSSVQSAARSTKLFQAALWGLLPILSIFVAAQRFPVLWQDRYALISAPYVLILLAAVWTQFWNSQKTIAILLAVLYTLSVSGPLLRYYTLNYRADWRGLSQELAISAQPNDPVLVYPGSFVEIIDYYDDSELNFLPMDDVIAAEDLNVEEAIALIKNTPLPHAQFWLICPVVDQWSTAKDNLIDQLEIEGFELQEDHYLLDQWAWGPALYRFSFLQNR